LSDRAKHLLDSTKCDQSAQADVRTVKAAPRRAGGPEAAGRRLAASVRRPPFNIE